MAAPERASLSLIDEGRVLPERTRAAQRAPQGWGHVMSQINGNHASQPPRVNGEPQPDADPLIYDWNRAEHQRPLGARGLMLLDETLRDGIQNPSVVDPKIGDKIEILHLLDELGVDFADIGLPGAGQRQFDDVLTLAKEVADNR